MNKVNSLFLLLYVQSPQSPERGVQESGQNLAAAERP